MPSYMYRCVKCLNEFEEFYTSFSKAAEEEPELACPACGVKEKERLVNSGVSFQLKGTGWASDNYGGSRRNRKSGK